MICNVNNTNLYFEKFGVGKPLILLHGNGETHEIFDKVTHLLAEHFTVYTPDSRGHGQSDVVLEYHYADIAEDIKCFIEVQGLERPMLYGFSDGGIVGLLLACTYPKLLSRLIVSGVNADPNGIKWICCWLFKLVHLVIKDPKIGMMLTEPNLTESMLKKIEIPTTILVGSRDVIKLKHTKFIAENISKSKLRVLKGESHGSYIVHSAKISKLILEETVDHGLL